MKNASKHAESLKSLAKRLLKEHKPEARQPQDPLHALVRGAMSYDVPDARAEEAMRVIGHEFVDLNELRVATELEVQDLLGSRYPEIEQRVAMITAALNQIFEREHTLSLDRLKTLSKRDARQYLRELPELHPFVEAYVMVYAFDGNVFPIDEALLTLLKEHGAVEEDAALPEAQKFVEQHLKADELFDLYAAARKAAFQEGRKPVATGKKKGRG